MTAKRFLKTALLTTVVTVGGFMAVTMGIDPYDYWGRARIEGLNVNKPLVHTHLVEVKKRQYLRAQPRTVIAGNSRVDVGLNPASPQWPGNYGPVYNFGMPGLGLSAVAEVLTTVMAEHRPERIYLGVDFIDFLLPRESWMAHQVVPLQPQQPAFTERARRFAETTLSLDALLHSAMTVMEQRKAHPANTRPDGFTPLENYHDHVRLEGHATLFEQRSRELVQRLLKEPRQLEWDAPGGNIALTRLEQFLELARAQNVEVVLFTYPYHAELLETLRQTGKWPDLHRWQEKLAHLAAREGVTLWSFTGYDAYSTEPVPEAGDRKSRMQWYWEAGHFKPELGELMIARMVERPDAPQDFGEKLTPDRLDMLTASLERNAETYQTQPGTASARVAAYVSAVGNRKLAQTDLASGSLPPSGGM